MKSYLLSASALALVAGGAYAQNVENTGTSSVQSEVVPVSERMAASHAPLGIRSGSFLVIPKVDLVETYNDNIYATNNNEESDFVTSINPEVAVRSNWNRHALNAVARANVKRYADNSSEDNDNYNVATDGRVDVLRNTSIGGGLSYSQEHEDRGDPNTIGSPNEPVQFNTTVGRIGAYRGLGKANARVDSEVRHIDYDNSTSVGGTVINNGVRDRNEYTQSLRLGYQLTDSFEGFVRGAWENRVYDNKLVARSSSGQTYTAGTSFDISGKTKGEAYAGVTKQSYTAAGRSSINKPTFGGKVTWNASDLTTVTGSVDRSIAETTIPGSDGFLNTNYNLGVEHGLTRDILLKANAGYTTNEYEGSAANQRDDKVAIVGLGADYYLNRCLKAGVGYSYTDRNSNQVNGDYSRNTVMLRLSGTY